MDCNELKRTSSNTDLPYITDTEAIPMNTTHISDHDLLFFDRAARERSRLEDRLTYHQEGKKNSAAFALLGSAIAIAGGIGYGALRLAAPEIDTSTFAHALTGGIGLAGTGLSIPPAVLAIYNRIKEGQTRKAIETLPETSVLYASVETAYAHAQKTLSDAQRSLDVQKDFLMTGPSKQEIVYFLERYSTTIPEGSP